MILKNLKKKMNEECLKCHKCDTKFSFNERYDAFYCKKCVIWLSSKCDDMECDFCKDRPDKPPILEERDSKK